MIATPGESLLRVRAEIAAVARASVTLVAVSKKQSADAVRAAAALGQRDFGENYVQEALAKIAELANPALCWHLIGPLQSNKCKVVAERFDWLQSLDRASLIKPLAQHRPAHAPPLQVLIQVNIDDEGSKAGVAPTVIASLAAAIAAEPRLQLRGLMAIPRPWTDAADRRTSFRALNACFLALRRDHATVDTLSMGMSEDYALAIEEGATMVRVGSAIFGGRRAT